MEQCIRSYVANVCIGKEVIRQGRVPFVIFCVTKHQMTEKVIYFWDIMKPFVVSLFIFRVVTLHQYNFAKYYTYSKFKLVSNHIMPTTNIFYTTTNTITLINDANSKCLLTLKVFLFELFSKNIATYFQKIHICTVTRFKSMGFLNGSSQPLESAPVIFKLSL